MHTVPSNGRRIIVLAAFLAAAAPAMAEPYQFVAAPHQGLNRVYRVDTVSGEVGACQYGLKEGQVGVTLCYPAGDGARSPGAGDYALVASNHVSEAGIFRVNRKTGDVSICYVFNDEKVVCTAPAR